MPEVRYNRWWSSTGAPSSTSRLRAQQGRRPLAGLGRVQQARRVERRRGHLARDLSRARRRLRQRLQQHAADRPRRREQLVPAPAARPPPRAERGSATSPTPRGAHRADRDLAARPALRGVRVLDVELAVGGLHDEQQLRVPADVAGMAARVERAGPRPRSGPCAGRPCPPSSRSCRARSTARWSTGPAGESRVRSRTDTTATIATAAIAASGRHGRCADARGLFKTKPQSPQRDTPARRRRIGSSCPHPTAGRTRPYSGRWPFPTGPRS